MNVPYNIFHGWKSISTYYKKGRHDNEYSYSRLKPMLLHVWNADRSDRTGNENSRLQVDAQDFYF
jgi:hypothetical protein